MATVAVLGVAEDYKHPVYDGCLLDEKNTQKQQTAHGHIHLYDVDDVVRQPEESERAHNEQYESTALALLLERGTAQAADDRGVAADDEDEGNQEAHDRLQQILEGHCAAHCPSGTGCISSASGCRQASSAGF